MEHVRKGKTKIGTVLSDAMDKSVTVLVERTVMDQTYKKYIRKKKKFMAHDEKNECKIGDVVQIRECRPLSKMKRWRVESIIGRSAE